MTNTHMQRKIQGREEENVETDGLHHGLQNNSRQSEDLESLTMSETMDNDNVQRKRPKKPFLYRVWRFLQTTATEVIKGDKPLHLDLDLPQRYRPGTIRAVCEATGFTATEVKRLYWSFKSECPSGMVNEESFHAIYSKFFPVGANFSCYPNYIFSTLDHRKSGVINFEDFAIGLSILLKGSDEDKLKWIFHLYDVNKDGVLTIDEFREVVTSIYDLMGNPFHSGERQRSEAAEQIIATRTESAFQMMDVDQDGLISLDDFLTFNKEDPKMNKSFDVLKTIPL